MKLQPDPAASSLLALALTAPLALLARADGDAQLPAGPTADQATTAKLVYGLLSDSRYAYRPRALDDALSAGHLQALPRSARRRQAVLHRAGHREVRAVQDRARRRDQERRAGAGLRDVRRCTSSASTSASRYARNLLKQDIFDFSGNDRCEYDREDAPWAADSAALDALWKQSVQATTGCA